MSAMEGRIAGFPQSYAVDSGRVDLWIDCYRFHHAAYGGDERRAVLSLADDLVRLSTREALAGTLTVAVHRLATQSDPERYRIAWRNAYERAAARLDALVEADAERDALRARLAEREDEVAELVARLAEYQGLIR